ncbi:MAG: hypothetical protein ACD_20C00293G0003 [uncultured bacterium]|nr:MAG: hypothetical protein ACD_20C00293G0003 [uncultured bacterium]HBH17788.1 hypothetical protein [Cyanobacteria bacterium UBA9579]
MIINSNFYRIYNCQASKAGMPAFQGLTNKLGNYQYNDPQEVKALIDKYPKSNAIVGNLPPEWIDKIKEKYPSQDERKKIIKEIYNVFGEVADLLRIYSSKPDVMHDASKKLGNAFNKAGVSQNFKPLEYKGRGSSGSGYMFQAGQKKYILKVYHTKDDYSSLESGNKPSLEANRGMFWKKNAAKDERHAKFYFADIKTSYNVVEFIENKIPLPKKIVDERIVNLRDNDVIDDDGFLINQISGRVIEYGGQYIISDAASKNKNLRYIFKQFIKLPADKRLEFVQKGLYYKNYPGIDGKQNLKKDFEKVLLDNFVRPHNYNNNYRNIFHTFDSDEKEAYFKVLAQNGDLDIKANLVGHLKGMKDKNKDESFNLLIENCDKSTLRDSKFLKALTDIFSYLPDKKSKLKCYEIVSQSNDKSLMEKLNDCFMYLPQEQKDYLLSMVNKNKKC